MKHQQQPADTAQDSQPRQLTEEQWNAGQGCTAHPLRRSGSCHECAMSEPPEPPELANAW